MLRYAAGWILDCEIRQHSPRTLEERRDLVDKLRWFLWRERVEFVDTDALRRFLAHVTRGHEEPGGRWGNPFQRRPVKPATVHSYYRRLRTLFNWLAEEPICPLADSPMRSIRPPVVRQDQIQPFTGEQVARLLEAARRSRDPRRDEAILLVLLDTGCRASELCGLNVGDVELLQAYCVVRGKGGKSRTLYLDKTTVRAVWAYLAAGERPRDAPLFLGATGNRLNRDQLRHMMERLARRAGVTAARCSPHTFRHTFAISFLVNGGNVHALREMLGHENISMASRYLALSGAEVESQHRRFSPVAALLGPGRKRRR